MRKIRKLSFTGILCVLAFSTAWAANDKSIQGDTRSNVQYSMKQYINSQSIDGQMYLFDSVSGKLLRLKLNELHSGIVKKGDFYVSCADFVDHEGRKIDLDFLVRPTGDMFLTTQALIHSINGKKRKYHLEKI